MQALETPVEAADALRVADLIAKIARVSLKDALRVMIALDCVAWFKDLDADELLDDVDYAFSRPTPENVAACERTFFELNAAIQRDPEMQRWRAGMKNLL